MYLGPAWTHRSRENVTETTGKTCTLHLACPTTLVTLVIILSFEPPVTGCLCEEGWLMHSWTLIASSRNNQYMHVYTLIFIRNQLNFTKYFMYIDLAFYNLCTIAIYVEMHPPMDKHHNRVHLCTHRQGCDASDQQLLLLFHLALAF